MGVEIAAEEGQSDPRDRGFVGPGVNIRQAEADTPESDAGRERKDRDESAVVSDEGTQSQGCVLRSSGRSGCVGRAAIPLARLSVSRLSWLVKVRIAHGVTGHGGAVAKLSRISVQGHAGSSMRGRERTQGVARNAGFAKATAASPPSLRTGSLRVARPRLPAGALTPPIGLRHDLP